MVNPVYRIETLRDKVVALLRKQKTAISRDLMAIQLELPTWAVDAGLESAMKGQLVTFAAGDGWWIAPAKPAQVCEGKTGLAPEERALVARISVAQEG